MRIQILSDVHTELHQDGGKGFVAGLDPSDVDVLIAAGDIGTISTIEHVLQHLCARYKHVVYVLGNHEFYGSRQGAVETLLAKLESKTSNLHWLNGSAVTIEEQRFIGGTLWFPEDPMNPVFENLIGDFSSISKLRDWVYKESDRLRTYLIKEVQASDVVVTHYLPSIACVSTRWMFSQLNRFFVNSMDGTIAERSPKLWVHGHTHDSKDFILGETRIVCNPFGYVGHQLNHDFVLKKLVDV